MIDIIVTTYNRVELLQRTMTSFFANTDMGKVSKIIVSNDGSTDGTQEYLEGLQGQFPKIRILGGHTERLGIIPRFNTALSACKSNVICEFQDDVEFTAGWLESLLGYLDKGAHFVTGFDAPEHKTFESRGGYLIKHSSRFTQLLARRQTWDQWFPMQPDHPFPTPTVMGGKCIGSNIDMKLSGMRKNSRRCKTRFLVVPGLIRHTAERYNSTWRNDISESSDNKTRYFGGLTVGDVKQYWRDRFRNQKGIAVGFAGKPKAHQEQILREKKEFILPKIDTNLKTIDYGCGIGLFSSMFDAGKYLGLDITQEFIDLAKQSNPEHQYLLLDSPFMGSMDLNFDIDLFFTANVLQHNCDYIVAELFKNLKSIKHEDFTLALYENTHRFVNTHHMCFRTPDDYLSFASEHFCIKNHEIFTHRIHGEDHSLIKISV